MICEYIKLKSEIKTKSSVTVNGIDINKEKALFPYKATMIARNNEVCQLDGRLTKDSFNLSIAFKDESYVVKFFDKQSNVNTIASLAGMVGDMIKDKSFDALGETLLPKIEDANGNQVGEMKYVTVEDYHYWKLLINNKELNCYVVGHDKKEILFCMYDNNDNMVATVSKAMNIRNGKSRYTMYIISDDWFKQVALLTSIIHQQEYEKTEGQGLGSYGKELDTYQKGLLEKYNANFIPEIVAKEGESNLPENMSLVAEKVKESQTTAGLNAQRIMTAIFIIGFAMLFIYLFFIAK